MDSNMHLWNKCEQSLKIPLNLYEVLYEFKVKNDLVHKTGTDLPPKRTGSSTFTHWELGRATRAPFSLRIKRMVILSPATYCLVSIATTLQQHKQVVKNQTNRKTLRKLNEPVLISPCSRRTCEGTGLTGARRGQAAVCKQAAKNSFVYTKNYDV